MKEIKGDIWKLYDQGKWVVIPTNMTLNRLNYAVMGAGIALEAKNRKPNIIRLYGGQLSIEPRKIYIIVPYRMILVPTKSRPKDNSSFILLEIRLNSCKN
jgi:hypothetical protein